MSITARKALTQSYFRMYPDEAARMLNNLTTEEVLKLFEEEPVSTVAGLLVKLNREKALELVMYMEDSFFRHLFATIDPSLGAPLLAGLDEDFRKQRLTLLPPELVAEYSELISYPPDTAGYLMDTKFLTCTLDDTVYNVLKQIRSVRDRRIIDVCVVDHDGCLVALIPLQEIAVALPGQKMGEIISAKPVSIHVLSPREDVVKLLAERKIPTLPVVDLNEKLLGVIRYDVLVTAAQQEVSEDVAAMFGAGRDERALSKVFFAVRKRLPWLQVNLVTAFLAASVVGIFEDTIARITALAIFLPVVAGQSGNTGSQALAVTMRGLALREIRQRHWLQVVRKEIGAGFINGCLIALTTAAAVYLWTHSSGLSVVIGTAMVFSMVVAGASGVIIPILLKKFGQDPAQSSAIILTTVTDIVGFMSFLGLATLLADKLTVG
jgi:magnesium transporter